MNDAKLGVIGGIWLAIIAFHASWLGYGDWWFGLTAMLTLGVVIPVIYGLQGLVARYSSQSGGSNET